jgi:hypothetical protein
MRANAGTISAVGLWVLYCDCIEQELEVSTAPKTQ